MFDGLRSRDDPVANFCAIYSAGICFLVSAVVDCLVASLFLPAPFEKADLPMVARSRFLPVFFNFSWNPLFCPRHSGFISRPVISIFDKSF